MVFNATFNNILVISWRFFLFNNILVLIVKLSSLFVYETA